MSVSSGGGDVCVNNSEIVGFDLVETADFDIAADHRDIVEVAVGLDSLRLYGRRDCTAPWESFRWESRDGKPERSSDLRSSSSRLVVVGCDGGFDCEHTGCSFVVVAVDLLLDCKRRPRAVANVANEGRYSGAMGSYFDEARSYSDGEKSGSSANGRVGSCAATGRARGPGFRPGTDGTGASLGSGVRPCCSACGATRAVSSRTRSRAAPSSHSPCSPYSKSSARSLCPRFRALDFRFHTFERRKRNSPPVFAPGSVEED